MEMIERIKTAMIEKIGIPDAELAESIAIVALQTIDEPTDAMKEAGQNTIQAWWPSDESAQLMRIRSAYQMMIYAALNV